jgi:hypothetical protein
MQSNPPTFLKYPMEQYLAHAKLLLKAAVYKNSPRVFCISMQRSGTTSVGKFFRDCGFRWAGWPNDIKNSWSDAWIEGNHEYIFSSPEFRAANAFEDSPWFLPGMYQVLFHRFPGSKFVLLTRDSDQWFKSMVKHSNGNVLGRTRTHCHIYRRERDYLNLLGNSDYSADIENQYFSQKTLKLEGYAQHYKDVYEQHNLGAMEFFQRNAPDALFTAPLNDDKKWQKLGAFLGVNVPEDYDSHENQSRPAAATPAAIQ